MTVSYTQRRFVRHAISTDCLLLSEGGDRLLGDRSLDVSYDGVLVLAPRPEDEERANDRGERRRRRVPGPEDARVGDPVRLSLRVPDTGLWVDAEGVVARCIGGRREADVGSAVAVHVTRMHGMSRTLLASVIRTYPRVEPVRGAGRDYARTIRRIEKSG